MGLSGNRGKFFLMPARCPIPLDGSPPPTGTLLDIEYEVTSWTETGDVYERKYGHDKSHQSLDVVFGNKSWTITVTYKLRVPNQKAPGVGNFIFCRLYPSGKDIPVNHLHGYAGVKQQSLEVNQEDGREIGGTLQLSSKGLWHGFSNDGKAFGGFECGADGNTGGGGSGNAWL